MEIDKLKVMLSFMREVNDGNVPKAEDYGLEKLEFWNVIDACQDDKLIKNVTFGRGAGNRIIYMLCEDATLTVKGLEYLHDHSKAMQTYKGLKEIRDWLPF